MRPSALAVAAAIALSAEGATAYRVNDMRVTVAGEKVCIEHQGAITYSALASDDGGKTFTAINHENRTWFPFGHPPLTPDASFCRMPYSNDPGVRRVKWSWTTVGADQYAGKLSYVVTEKATEFTVDIQCSVAIDVTTTSEHPRELWPAPVFFRTGLPAVDTRIAPDLEAIRGFPLRIAVTVTRRYTGGKPDSQEQTMTVTDIRAVPDAPVAACARPADYREQRPVIAAPGL